MDSDHHPKNVTQFGFDRLEPIQFFDYPLTVLTMVGAVEPDPVIVQPFAHGSGGETGP